MGTKISELSTASALTGAELVPVKQGTETVSVTVALLRLTVAAGAVSSAGALSGEIGTASAARTGTGAYTVTLDDAPTTGVLVLTAHEVGIVTQNGPIGTTFDVATYDAAGAAADVGFSFVVLDVG